MAIYLGPYDYEEPPVAPTPQWAARRDLGTALRRINELAVTSSADITSRINNLGLLLDVDGNSRIDPLSDGLLVLRYLFGIRGTTLINGVIATDATRTTASEIESYLAKIAPNL